MKSKKILLTMIVGAAIIGTTLIGCSNKVNTVDNNTNPIKDNTIQVSVQEEKENTQSISKEKINEYNYDMPQIGQDIVTISPKHVYYQDGKLIMEAFVYNGCSRTAYNINNVSIKLGIPKGDIIAEANFGTLEGLKIASNTYGTWTFTFPTSCVYIKDANLSDLAWSSDVKNNY